MFQPSTSTSGASSGGAAHANKRALSLYTGTYHVHGPWVYVNQFVPELCHHKPASNSTFTCVVCSLAGGHQLVAICQHEGMHSKCNRVMFVPDAHAVSARQQSY